MRRPDYDYPPLRVMLITVVIFWLAAFCGCPASTGVVPHPIGPPEMVDKPVPVPPPRLPRPAVPQWRTQTACTGRQPAEWPVCLDAMGQDLREAWALIGRLYAIIDTNNAAVDAMARENEKRVAPR